MYSSFQDFTFTEKPEVEIGSNKLVPITIEKCERNDPGAAYIKNN